MYRAKNSHDNFEEEQSRTYSDIKTYYKVTVNECDISAWKNK